MRTRCRAERPATGRRLVRLRRAATLTRALAAGALERAVELAAALEVRGYAATPGRRRSHRRAPWSFHDFAFCVSALALAAMAVGVLAGGIATFDPYPTLKANLDAAVAAFAVATVGLALLPFWAGALWGGRIAHLDTASAREGVPSSGGGHA